MHSYAGIKLRHGNRVSQTIDAPIVILDYWQLGDAGAVIIVVLVFGIMLYEWAAMIVLLLVVLVLAPIIRATNERGVFLHWPYRHLGISLPGLINPEGRKIYSD